MPQSLPESFRSVEVPRQQPWWQRLLAFLGPGYLVSVGYMDPGNWATDLAAGSQYGYRLLFVIGLSSLMAMVLQTLCVRLGLGAQLDLAQACRRCYPQRLNWLLWLLCELAIIACDLAELLGTAIALQLLLGLPLLAGILLTALDSLLLLALQERGFRRLEALVIGLVALVGSALLVNVVLAQPDWGAVAAGLRPEPQVLRDPQQLYLAMGILGATVMPHNLYLHSAIVQTRDWGHSDRERREAVRWASLDTVMALGLAMFVNGAILIVAAASFHAAGRHDVVDLAQAYHLLSPMLGAPIASTLFGLALLAAGQSSTLTATLAGQVVMEGFLNLRLPPWQRRLLTRTLAIAPAAAGVILFGESSSTQLLILSQVVLSLQLPFAVIPLVQFTGRRSLMGDLTSPRWLQGMAWAIAAILVWLNLTLLVRGLGAH